MRLLLLAAAAATYCLAAWLSPPGFYDGFCPPVTSYNWLVPPTGQRSGGPPGSASVAANNSRGPYFVATNDSNPQAQLSWLPQAFDADPNATVTITVKPTTKCSTPPAGVELTTNVYDIEASAKLVKQGNLRLVLAPNLPSATVVYHAGSDCQWSAITNTSPGGCGDIQVRIGDPGFYAAGVSNVAGAPGAPRRSSSGVQSLLPWIVAGAIVVVILAGLPLALVRRRPPRRGGGRANPPPSRRRPRRRT